MKQCNCDWATGECQGPLECQEIESLRAKLATAAEEIERLRDSFDEQVNVAAKWEARFNEVEHRLAAQSAAPVGEPHVHIDNVVYHLDDIEVDENGKCAWTDVANALTHIKLCIEPPAPAPISPQWQPIETAPKDEQEFLGCRVEDDGTFAYRVVYRDHSNPEFPWHVEDAGEGFNHHHKFLTHWMPIPDAPALSVKPGEQP